MSQFFKVLLGVSCVALLSSSSASAFCPRCAAIEGKRAEEQAKNPPKDGYYDDSNPVHQQTSQNANPKKSQ